MLTEEQQSIIDSIKDQFETLNKPVSNQSSLVDTSAIINEYQKKQERITYADMRNKQINAVLQHKVQDMRDRLATDLWDLNLEVEWTRETIADKFWYELHITHRFGVTNRPHTIKVKPCYDRTEGGLGVYSSEILNFTPKYSDDTIYPSRSNSIEEYCKNDYFFKRDIKKLYEDNANCFK